MKVMIDRSAFGISLVKIFGYRMKEIRKLYLNGNFYVIAVGTAVCIPLAKVVMDAMYPLMVSNVAVSYTHLKEPPVRKVQIHRFGFIGTFRLRQMLRELRTGLESFPRITNQLTIAARCV